VHVRSFLSRDSHLPPVLARRQGVTASVWLSGVERLHRLLGNQTVQRWCNMRTPVIQLQTQVWPRDPASEQELRLAIARLGDFPGVPREIEDGGEGAMSVEAGLMPPATEESETKPRPLQTKLARGAGNDRAAIDPRGILNRLDDGSQMGSPLRSSAERFFGTSFRDVRLHSGPRADALTGSLGAEAFTIGNHVAFAAGRYRPDTTEGQRLVAHELTHVIQQRRGITGVVLSERIGRPGDRYERQADEMAEWFSRGSLLLPGAGAPTADASAERPASAIQLFSGSAAGTYARTWALSTNSAYGRFGNDCTNFVSQAMDAGGWTHLAGSGYCADRKKDSVWWFTRGGCRYTACPWGWCPTIRTIDASHTWGGAHNFYNFVKTTGRGTGAAHVMNLGEGDVLQMDFSGGGHIGHTMVVTGKTATNLFLSYHTSDHLDEPFYPDGKNAGILARNPDPPTKYYGWKM